MRTVFFTLVVLLLPLAGSLSSATQIPRPKADLILFNGHIWTGDKSRPWVEAVAIDHNIISQSGTNESVGPLAMPQTRLIDLGGRFVMPGINDAHIHFLGGSLGLFQVNLTGAKSLDELQKRVADFARANPREAWITGSGWEYSALPGGRLPTRKDLDEVVSDRPVCLASYDGHTCWANSKALQLAGITAQSKFDGYGEIVVDKKTGQPTGVFKEGAQRLVRSAIPEPSTDRKLEALRRGMKMAAALGITSIQNASGSEAEVDLYQALLARGELTLRVSFALSVGPQTTEQELERIRQLSSYYSNERLRVRAIKIVLDGVIETHTAAMLEPYSDDSTTSGKPVYTQQQLNKIVAWADRARLQVLIHAIGDRAVRMALDAFENARKVNGIRDSRFRIEHIETVAAADIPRFAKLGVIASMMPVHADPGTNDVWLPAIGEERASRGFAWRSLQKSGARLVFSSDWPAVINVDPIRGLHTAVTRQTVEGQPAGGWLPEQRLSLEEALEAYTAAGAFASFEERTKGTITSGMRADLVALDADPFKLAPSDLHRLRVALTVFDGRVIYQKP